MALRSAIAALLTLVLVSTGQAVARPAQPAAPGTYVVRPGDTLSMLARRSGATVAALAEANQIADIHRILAGVRLVFPARGTDKVASAEPKASDRLPAHLRQRPERLALLPRFDAAAREFAVPADLLKAITWQESGWQNDKVSSTKARGIGQLMPDTVAFVNGSLLRARLDPGRPEDNIRMSARFLAYLLQRTKGDVRTAVSAYYQGLGSVQRRGPYPSTRRYVDDVLALQRKF